MNKWDSFYVKATKVFSVGFIGILIGIFSSLLLGSLTLPFANRVTVAPAAVVCVIALWILMKILGDVQKRVAANNDNEHEDAKWAKLLDPGKKFRKYSVGLAAFVAVGAGFFSVRETLAGLDEQSLASQKLEHELASGMVNIRDLVVQLEKEIARADGRHSADLQDHARQLEALSIEVVGLRSNCFNAPVKSSGGDL